MIAKGTLIRSKYGEVQPVEKLATWQKLNEVSNFPLVCKATSTAKEIMVLECWYETTCRNCLHRKTRGLIISATADQNVLLKNGEWATVAELQNGTRLAAGDSCDCGYLEVKSAERVRLETPTAIYKVEGEFEVTDGKYAALLQGFQWSAVD